MWAGAIAKGAGFTRLAAVHSGLRLVCITKHRLKRSSGLQLAFANINQSICLRFMAHRQILQVAARRQRLRTGTSRVLAHAHACIRKLNVYNII